MPAAAVIPALIAYINVVAVKKLVVGFWSLTDGLPIGVYCLLALLFWEPHCSLLRGAGTQIFTLKKLECSKQANALNTLAWNNGIGLWSYFVGF